MGEETNMRRWFLMALLGYVVHNRLTQSPPEPPKPCTCEEEEDPDERTDYYKRELGLPVA
jgi:hypothetical protein